jgi:hypothetical protein
VVGGSLTVLALDAGGRFPFPEAKAFEARVHGVHMAGRERKRRKKKKKKKRKRREEDGKGPSGLRIGKMGIGANW